MRAASKTMRSRTSAGSRMAETRAAISRRVRSASARRSMTSRERSSWSMRWTVAMATGRLVGQADEDRRVGRVEAVHRARHRR